MQIERISRSDRVAFDGLCRIYSEAIRPEEQKPPEQLGQMLARDEYAFIIAGQPGSLAGFAILFAPPDEDFALLEYLAVAAERRGRGLGGRLLAFCAEWIGDWRERVLLIEVDRDSPGARDLEQRRRRIRFYQGCGCRRIAGLDYQLPLPAAPAEPMDLLALPRSPVGAITRARIERWLNVIYVRVYGRPATDPRLAAMIAPLPERVPLVQAGRGPFS
jgi:GNAT superfamily N-acetyltransferase